MSAMCLLCVSDVCLCVCRTLDALNESLLDGVDLLHVLELQ